MTSFVERFVLFQSVLNWMFHCTVGVNPRIHKHACDTCNKHKLEVIIYIIIIVVIFIHLEVCGQSFYSVGLTSSLGRTSPQLFPDRGV